MIVVFVIVVGNVSFTINRMSILSLFGYLCNRQHRLITKYNTI